jgi:hypothetical protein
MPSNVATERVRSEDSLRRQLEGARRGGDLVRSEFAASLTRRRYCELVGIHPMTLKRWEKAGIVEPTTQVILKSPTRVFAPEDVAFGKRLVALIQEKPGTLSLRAAAKLVRRDREPTA